MATTVTGSSTPGSRDQAADVTIRFPPILFRPPAVVRPPSKPRLGSEPDARAVAVTGVLLAAFVIGFFFAPTAWHLWREPERQLVLPDRIDSLVREDNQVSHDTVDRLGDQLAAATRVASTTGAVYVDQTGQSRSVIVVGGAGTVGSTETAVDKALALISDEPGGVQDTRRVPSGDSGSVTKCGVVTTDRSSTAVCGWASRGGVGIAIFPNRGVDESASLMRRMRSVMHCCG